MAGKSSKVKRLQNSEHLKLVFDIRFISIIFIGFTASLGTNIASAALPSIADAFGVSDSQAGLIITVYTFPAMVMVPLSGVLADIYGRRIVVVPCLLVYGFAGGAIVLVDSFFGILALRVIQGMAVAGIMPITVTVLGDLYSGAAGSTAQGLRVAALGLIGISIPAFVGYLSEFAWNIPFLLYLFGIFAGIFTYIFLPETSGEVETKQSVSATFRIYWQSLRDEITEVNTAVLISGGFARNIVRYGLITFLPLFAVRSLDASYAMAGTILSVRGVAQILVSPLSGVISVYFSRKQSLIGSTALASLSAILIPFAPNVIWLAGTFAIYAVGDAIFSPVIKDTVTDTTPDENRSGVISGMKTFGYGGQTAGPVFFGAILAVAGFGVLFRVAGVLIGAYGVLLFLTLDDSVVKH